MVYLIGGFEVVHITVQQCMYCMPVFLSILSTIKRNAAWEQFIQVDDVVHCDDVKLLTVTEACDFYKMHS